MSETSYAVDNLTNSVTRLTGIIDRIAVALELLTEDKRIAQEINHKKIERMTCEIDELTKKVVENYEDNE